MGGARQTAPNKVMTQEKQDEFLKAKFVWYAPHEGAPLGAMGPDQPLVPEEPIAQNTGSLTMSSIATEDAVVGADAMEVGNGTTASRNGVTKDAEHDVAAPEPTTSYEGAMRKESIDEDYNDEYAMAIEKPQEEIEADKGGSNEEEQAPAVQGMVGKTTTIEATTGQQGEAQGRRSSAQDYLRQLLILPQQRTWEEISGKKPRTQMEEDLTQMALLQRTCKQRAGIS